MARRIRSSILDQFVDRLSDLRDRINSGQRPRRGIGTAGLKRNHDHYKLGGKKC